ncbi:adenine phosphoribosyltransferase [Nocardiopsis nanhaiensis]
MSNDTATQDVPDAADDLALIKAQIRDIPDFPHEGILFKDITPLLNHPAALAAAVRGLTAPYLGGGVDHVVGLEARGFIFGAPVAMELGAGFVPARKAGKLPAETIDQAYDLEYGTATVEMHADAITPGSRVLVVDDVLATGGTGRAAVELVRKAGGTVVGFSVLLELSALQGREKMPDVELHTLLSV